MWLQKPPLGVPLDWSNPLNKGLVMHLATNEGHGDHLNDLSMNGNHGTIQNMAFPSTAASGWNPGRAGVGLNFDGIDDHVNCGNNALLQLITAMTISFCANVGIQSVDYPKVMERGAWGVGGYYVDISGVIGTTEAQLRFGRIGGSDAVSPIIPYNPNVENIFVFVIDAVADEGKAYLNGNNVGVLSPISVYVPGSFDFYMVNDRSFVGSIDQVRILNRAWTAKEVLEYYINPWSVYLDEDN